MPMTYKPVTESCISNAWIPHEQRRLLAEQVAHKKYSCNIRQTTSGHPRCRGPAVTGALLWQGLIMAGALL